MMNLHFVIILLALNLTAADVNITEVLIGQDNIIQTIPDKFLSVTIDTAVLQANWSTLNLRSKKVQQLAKGLTPCYLRVGGSPADFLQFQAPNIYKKHKRDVDAVKNLKLTNFTMTAQQWDELNQFVETVGWDLIFDLNGLLRSNGYWSTENAEILLDYTVKKGYKIAGWELGNEPNVWRELGYNINGTVHARDYLQLKDLLDQYPQFHSTKLIGPSVTMLTNIYVDDYLRDFLEAGGPSIVTNPTFHHYYGHGPDMTVEKFMDPGILNSLEKQIDIAQSYGSPLEFGKFWLSETSSAWGGGAKGLSDTYVAGFMWLDKLGMSAVKGLGSVIRQSFYYKDYALLDTETFHPNPDYWSSKMFKEFVGSSVLKVLQPSQRGDVRLYTHCINSKSSLYKKGGITIYVMNVRKEPTTMTFPQFPPSIKLYLYLLEPIGPQGLTSKMIAVNGNILKLNEDLSFPDLTKYSEVVAGNFTLPQQAYGFIVIPDANVSVCF